MPEANPTESRIAKAPRHNAGNSAFYGNSVAVSKDTPHEAVLQALNRWITYDSGDTYLGLENFQGTEGAWGSVPVFYSDGLHPDMSLVESDPESAAAKINGMVLPPGTISDIQVLVPGQPRLAGKAKFTDPKLQALYDAGKLSVSTGFYADEHAGKISGQVIPNHILIFEQGKYQPRDPGAMFLNTEEPRMSMSEKSNAGAVFSKKNLGLIESAVATLNAMLKGLQREQPAVEEDDAEGPAPKITNTKENTKMEDVKTAALESQIAELKKFGIEYQNTIKERDAALERVNAELASLKEKAAQDAEDSAWVALKNTDIMPKAWLDTPEHEGATRTEWKNSKDAFVLKLAALKRAPERKQEGSEFENATGSDDFAAQKRLLGMI